MKLKCQCILDLYLDSQLTPSIQVDINNETYQKLIKTLAKVMQGTQNSADMSAFDDAKALLIKDLLPYWSGFKHSYKPSSDKPLTKTDKMLKERLDEFMSISDTPFVDFKLPPISAKYRDPVHTASNATLHISFSLATGIKFKDEKALALSSLNNSNQTNLNNGGIENNAK